MNIPPELIEQFARGNGVLFVGAGFSQGAGLPGWNDLLAPLADRIGLPPHLRTDPLKVAQHYDNQCGRQALIQHVIEQTDSMGQGPTENHRQLLRLGARSWVTTNYDDLIERTFQEAGIRYNKVVHDQDLPYTSADAATLVKMHGDRQQADTIIITERDYQTYFRRFPRIKDKLAGLLLEKTFLFVGYSVNDPDFNQIQAEIAYDLQQHQRLAYAVLFDADGFTLSDLRSRNIHVLNMPLEERTDRSQQLGELLDELNRQVDEARQRREQKARPAAVVATTSPPAEEVRGLLEAMGYRINDAKAVGSDLYFLCDAKWGAEIRQEVVHFVGCEPTAKDIAALNDTVITFDAARGILLTRQLLSDSLCNVARQRERIQCYTVAQFTDRLADFRPYLERMIQEYEASEIPSFYVPLAAESEGCDGRESQVFKPLESFVDAWLTEPGRNHLSILGDFGSGKTWFCQRYAYLAARRYLADPGRNRIPILITLRDYSRAYDVEQLITDAVANRYKVSLTAGYKTFARLNEAGRLLLIFDGFDEMERRVSDYRTTVSNFWELAKAMCPASKVLLTCRTAYFRHRGEEEETLTRRRRTVSWDAGDQVIALSGKEQFEVVHLLDFDEEAIRLALQKRLPAGWEPVYKKTQDLANLRDLASRPVLLDMIVRTLPQIQDAREINQSTLYEAYVNELLERRWAEDTDYIPPRDRLLFMQELAWEMYQTQRLSIPFSEFPERVIQHFRLREDPERAAFFERDVRTQSYLVRDSAGNYHFAHKSFMEYFVACMMADAVIRLDSNLARALDVWKTQPLTPEVQGFLLRMVADSTPLWHIIEATRGTTALEVGYAGGNAATLLRLKGESFLGAQLAGTVLVHADLSAIDLSGVDLSGACLRETNLIACVLENANMSGADLADIQMDERSAVFSAVWSADGKHLFTGGADANLQVWDTYSWQSSFTFPVVTPSQGTSQGVGRMVLCYHSDTNRVIFLAHSRSEDEIRELSRKASWHEAPQRPSSRCGVLNFDPSATMPIWATQESSECLGFGKLPDMLVESLRGSFVGISDDGFVDIDSNGDFHPYMLPAPASLTPGVGFPTYFEALTSVPGARVLLGFRNPVSGRLLTLVKRRDGGFFDLEWGAKRVLVKDLLAADYNGDLWLINRGNYVHTGHKLASVTVVCSDSSRIFFALEAPEHTIEVWDLQTCELRESLKGHKARIGYLDLSPDGTRLASCSYDSTIRVWNVDLLSLEFGQCLKVLEPTRFYKNLVIRNATGLDTPAPDGEGTLRNWLIARGAVE